MRFEFRLYDRNADFVRSEIEEARDIPAARQKAGRWSKRCGGPVDLATADTDAPWDERYLVTASPCEFRKCGFRFERIES